MSQSGVFRLVARDQRFDNFFTASDFLRRRLTKIRVDREKRGEKNAQPTFTDLEKTHILFLRAIYRPFVAMACEYVRVKPRGDAAVLSATGGTVAFTFPIYGHFTSDMVFRVRFKSVGTASPVVPVAGQPPPPNLSPRFRYCAYPGLRLFRRVSFKSDETLIDDYTSDESLFVDKFRIPADRRLAWDRGMGQGEVRTAEYFISDGFTGVVQYREGPQTPKFLQPALELWVPLDFWMCEDAANALLNDLIPNTQRTIVAELAPLQEILQAQTQGGSIIPLPIGQLGMQIDLYVNNIFVNPEIHDIFASRIGFSLIRVHRRQKKILNMGESSILMDQLKFPTEYLYLGFRDLKNFEDFDHWHLFGRARDDFNLRGVAGVENVQLQMCQLVCREAKETSTLDPIVQSFKLTSHDIDLYPELSAGFYNTYLPQRYFNGTSIVAPSDTSVYIATFCLYPGQFNPNGYLNLSAGREFYLTYRSDKIDSENPAELFVTASALNFLVRNGDKVHLRYAL
jgi:hypothetical protein